MLDNCNHAIRHATCKQTEKRTDWLYNNTASRYHQVYKQTTSSNEISTAPCSQGFLRPAGLP